MSLTIAANYRLRDPDVGVWWFYIPSVYGKTVEADGVPMTASPQQGWYAAEGTDPPALIEVITPARTPVVEYRRRPGVEIDDWPFALSPSEAYDRDEGMAVIGALYDAVTEEVPATRTAIDQTEMIDLVGAPPPKDGRRWTGKAPWTLREAPEFSHLFPGHLEGFREAVQEAFDRIPGVTAYIRHGSPPWTVNRTLATGETRKVKRGRNVEETQGRITVPIPVGPIPSYIEGRNRADAVAEWDARLAGLAALVESYGHACPTCHGKGYVA